MNSRISIPTILAAETLVAKRRSRQPTHFAVNKTAHPILVKTVGDPALVMTAIMPKTI